MDKNMYYVKPCRDGTYSVMNGNKLIKNGFITKLKAESYMRKKKK